MLAIAGTSFGQGATGEVTGYVRDAKTNQTVYGARVFINDIDRVYQARTGTQGEFRISGVPAGDYMVNIISGEDTMRNIAATVPVDGLCRLGDIKFDSKILILDGATVTATGSIRMIDGNLPVTSIDQEIIKTSPAKFDQKSLIASMTSDVKLTDDGELVFRGARKGDMLYQVDGIKGRAIANLPSCSLGSITVYSGGLPAKYGDTTGGAVIVETLGYFDLYRTWVGQQIKEGKM